MRGSSSSRAGGTGLTASAAWRSLQLHSKEIRRMHLRRLFQDDPGRGERLTAEAAGLFLDYSKNLITDETLMLLFQLAEQRGLRSRIEAMFKGEKINLTEKRAALHVALRAPESESIVLDGVDVVPLVHTVLDKMAAFSEEIRSGQRLGYTGKRIRNIVNVGLGGSDLGPMMADTALRHYSRRDLNFRFVSNVDGTDFEEAVRGLQPAETLFILSSKSFTTPETLANAKSARRWCLDKLGGERAIARHFVAVSSSSHETARFGIPEDNLFRIWDWVGGRYSMDSAIGLATMIAVGEENFRGMLAGFHAMDRHFRTAPFAQNLPVLMGLLSVWYSNFFDAQSAAILPYDEYLQHLPVYLQQLTMESNGKHVDQDGVDVDYTTSPVYWGQRGVNSQHSFYQLLHQGTCLVPCDFIGFCRSLSPLDGHHDMLMANFFAQAEALAFGKSAAQLKAENVPDWQLPYRVLEGDRPSNTLLAESLTPETFGALVALYEHSVFTQGVIWNIDSFDQWGVELGKMLAKSTLRELVEDAEPELGHDSSTNNLIRRYRKLRQHP
jgi:glucose-6-phosphate isomerase